MANVDFGRYKKIVQLIWNPEPRNDDMLMPPIWCLGKEYAGDRTPQATSTVDDSNPSSTRVREIDHVKVTAERSPLGSKKCDANGGSITSLISEDGRSWPTDFLNDFESRFYFTYRSHFQTIKRSADPNAASSMSLSVRLRSQFVDQDGFTNDTGWGCMIRSGQCLIANAMSVIDLGRDWRRGSHSEMERSLLSLFADDPRAAFSLHRFVEHGASACGKYPGQWFGPSAAAKCIQALSHDFKPNKLKVYVTGDGGADIYEDTFLKLAFDSEHMFQPVLILVATRLGITGVTPVYWESLKLSFQLPQSLGIAGGCPSSSYYFVGVQGDNFFYLDPHLAQPALPWHEHVADYTIGNVDSCHTRRLRRVHIKDMDPSMLIAFLIKDLAEWRSWRRDICKTSGKPIVRISDQEPLSPGQANVREAAVDEVATFDDEDEENRIDDSDDELVNIPRSS